MYYPCSENKGADQLRGYREAELRLLFSHMQKAGFHMTRFIFVQSCDKTWSSGSIRYDTNRAVQP